MLLKLVIQREVSISYFAYERRLHTLHTFIISLILLDGQNSSYMYCSTSTVLLVHLLVKHLRLLRR